jgi:hypothetical protein
MAKRRETERATPEQIADVLGFSTSVRGTCSLKGLVRGRGARIADQVSR